MPQGCNHRLQDGAQSKADFKSKKNLGEKTLRIGLVALHKEAAGRQVKPDDHSELVPPLPIPNRTVKQLSADDSADYPCESRSSSGYLLQKTPCSDKRQGVFSFRRFLLRIDDVPIVLQPMAAVAIAESNSVEAVLSIYKRNNFEQLAHFMLKNESLRFDAFRNCGTGKVSSDPAIQKKMRLTGVAQNFQAAILARQRDAGEINMAGDVFAANVNQGVSINTVAIMAHQSAANTLCVIVLGVRETVVDKEQNSFL
jgi:hypothetical protein